MIGNKTSLMLFRRFNNDPMLFNKNTLLFTLLILKRVDHVYIIKSLELGGNYNLDSYSFFYFALVTILNRV